MGENWHGLRFPFKTTAQSLFAEPSDVDLVNSSIQMILNTPVGDYISLPEFGSLIHHDLFEQNDFVLKALLGQHITESLKRWEPRIILVNMRVVINENEVRLTIKYRLKANSSQLQFFEDTLERNPG
jgi:phage baseplate assembly protein W